ncbi:MAG: ankyrin repeat domain-containing protein [Epsilonproteobacteria bacterium]|nr:ankyrin repeat domain-containing protein [Campylobacterota bacterium]
MKKCLLLAMLCCICSGTIVQAKTFVAPVTVVKKAKLYGDLITPKTEIFDAAGQGDRHLTFHLIEVFSSSEGDEFLSQKDLSSIFRLLAQKADVAQCDEQGKTLLHDLVAVGDTKAVEIVLARKPDVNTQDNDGETPLHVATRRNNGEIVTLLLKAGSDWKMLDFDDYSPLHFAALYGNKSVLDALVSYQGVDINHANDFGVTPIQIAAMWGLVNNVRLLLLAGADPELSDVDGRNALDHACQCGHDDVVSLIKQHLSKRLGHSDNSLHEEE